MKKYRSRKKILMKSKWRLHTLKSPRPRIKKLVPGTEINLDDRLPVYKTCTIREIVEKINEIIDFLNK